MGYVDLSCITLNGTKLMGLSLAKPVQDYSNLGSNLTAVLLLESDSPSSLKDLSTLAVNSLWSHSLSSHYKNDGMLYVCQVDPVTGIFSVVHTNSGKDPKNNKTLALIPPGGFQYDPATTTWSEFAMSPDFKWNGDPSISLAVFTWPNTSTLFLATIGNSSTVNIGMLNPGDTGAGQDRALFVNYFSWSLDPAKYGYPRRVLYGNGAIYQIGSVISDNNTGAESVMVTRIPLTGDPSKFYPPTNLVAIQSSDLNKCDPAASSGIAATFYKDTLYIICKDTTIAYDDNADTYDYANDDSFLFMVRENGSLSTGNVESTVSYEFYPSSLIQAMPRGGNENDRWCVTTGQYQSMSIGLNANNLGNLSSDSYGFPWIDLSFGIPPDPPTKSQKAVIGGSVAGGIVLLVLLILAFRRWAWPRLSQTYWPQWRDQTKAKLIAMLTKDEQEPYDQFGDKKVLQEDGEDEQKLEEGLSMHTIEDGRDKILVTDDMGLDKSVVSVDSAYMEGVVLESHPRPTFVTVLNDEITEPSSVIDSAETSTLSLPLQRAAGMTTNANPRNPQAITGEPSIVTFSNQDDTGDSSSLPAVDAPRIAEEVGLSVIPLSLSRFAVETPSAPPIVPEVEDTPHTTEPS
ncbi:hypothetical protein BGZ83_002814 [Gryganskiella cystojenkinii]|nr:hypothetical protein BGZ83_002814 [Gryganskiella cystojenkinii]